MLRLAPVLTAALLLLQFPCQAADCTYASDPVEIADAGTQETELMKQSDYRHRLDEEKQEKETERHMASLGMVETENRGTDRFVIIILAISAVALILLSKRVTTYRRGRHRRL